VDPLFSPVRIGGVELRNRIVFPPMTTRLAGADGDVTDELVAYYRARAAGGAGLVTVEMASPEPAGRHRRHELGIADDRFLPGLRRLAAAVHADGAHASLQLGHGGSRAPRAVSGTTPVAPSAVPTRVTEVESYLVEPEAMSLARVEAARDAFARAARRVQQAGFDCVELHGAHGYLVSQFLAPAENRRTDRYGGPLENRARFALDLIGAVKEAAPDLAVVFRLGVEDFFDGGVTLDEGVRVAAWAAAAGADCVSVTAGHYRSVPSAERMIPPMAYPEGTFVAYAAAVRERVDVPVIAVGRLGDPERARAVIDGGRADLVVLGRTLLADPEWPNRVRAGEPVRRCLSCNYCVNSMRAGERISCAVNGAAGRELAFADPRPPHGERIAVVGAGPAGLSYASLVAEGNRVEVLEREAEPGGAFRYTGKAPLFGEVAARGAAFEAYVRELERACRRQGVTFRYSTAASPALLAGFDRVVLATGARYRLGAGPLVRRLLDAGAGKTRLARKVFARPRVRSWFYYRARRGTAQQARAAVPAGPRLVVIGDAARAGTAREAVASAFRAALLGEEGGPGAQMSLPAAQPPST
jgi:dimethylglycine catabolism A